MTYLDKWPHVMAEILRNLLSQTSVNYLTFSSTFQKSVAHSHPANDFTQNFIQHYQWLLTWNVKLSSEQLLRDFMLYWNNSVQSVTKYIPTHAMKAHGKNIHQFDRDKYIVIPNNLYKINEIGKQLFVELLFSRENKKQQSTCYFRTY